METSIINAAQQYGAFGLIAIAVFVAPRAIKEIRELIAFSITQVRETHKEAMSEGNTDLNRVLDMQQKNFEWYKEHSVAQMKILETQGASLSQIGAAVVGLGTDIKEVRIEVKDVKNRMDTFEKVKSAN